MDEIDKNNWWSGAKNLSIDTWLYCYNHFKTKQIQGEEVSPPAISQASKKEEAGSIALKEYFAF